MATLSSMDAAALAGFNGQGNPYIYSSPHWYACELGKYLRASGRPAPQAGDIRMSRGYSVRCRDMVFAVGGDSKAPTFERVK